MIQSTLSKYQLQPSPFKNTQDIRICILPVLSTTRRYIIYWFVAWSTGITNRNISAHYRNAKKQC